MIKVQEHLDFPSYCNKYDIIKVYFKKEGL